MHILASTTIICLFCLSPFLNSCSNSLLPDIDQELTTRQPILIMPEDIFDVSKIKTSDGKHRLQEAMDVLKKSFRSREIFAFLLAAHGANGGVKIIIDSSVFDGAPEGASAKFIAPNTIVFRSAYDITEHSFIEEVMHVIQDFCIPGGIDPSIRNTEYEAKVATDILIASGSDIWHFLGSPYHMTANQDYMTTNGLYYNWVLDIAQSCKGTVVSDLKELVSAIMESSILHQ